MKRKAKIAFFPDRLAHYRMPVFKELSKFEQATSVTIFSNPQKSIASVVLGNWKKHELTVRSITEVTFNEIVFWQSKIVFTSLSKHFDLIVCWGESNRVSTWVAATMAYLTRKPLIMWTHGFYGNESLLKNVLRSIFYNLASSLLLYGKHAESLFIKKGFNRNRLSVIYNSLDYFNQLKVAKTITKQDIAKKRISIVKSSTNAKIIIYCGRITRKKELTILLQLIKLSNQNHTKYKLLVVGDGPYFKEFQKEIKQLDIKSDVILIGPCYDEAALAQYFQASDLCVSPGSVGLTAIHSLTYGTPVATHSERIHQKPEAECIHSMKNGFLFKRGDAYDLAKKTEEWFQTQPSRDRINDYCKKHIFLNYNPRKQAQIFHGHLKQYVHSNPTIV